MKTITLTLLFLSLLITGARADTLDVLAAPYANPAFSTDGPAMWNALVATAQRPDRNFQIRAILNPDSGPGSTPEMQQERFEQFFGTSGNGLASQFRNAGGELVGYVWTDRGRRVLSEVTNEIDTYMTGIYAGNVDGIFLDDFYDDASDVAYYQALSDYVETNYPSMFLIGNVGNVGQLNELTTGERTDLISNLDTLVSHEMDLASYTNDYVALDDALSFDEKMFSHLIHDSGTWDESTLSLALGRHTGWLYATPDSGANPWDDFDNSFWNSFTDSVIASNVASVPEPSCFSIFALILGGLGIQRRRS